MNIRIHLLPDGINGLKSTDLVTNALNEKEACAIAFGLGNDPRQHRSWEKQWNGPARSLSVGDVVEIDPDTPFAQLFVCAEIGWEAISKKDFPEICKITNLYERQRYIRNLKFKDERPIRTTHLAIGVEGSDEPIVINVTKEPWFSEGIVEANEPCTYEGTDTDAQHAWYLGRKFARTIGFEGVTAALQKISRKESINVVEASIFDKDGCILPEIEMAAKVLKDSHPEAAEMLDVYTAVETLRRAEKVVEFPRETTHRG